MANPNIVQTTNIQGNNNQLTATTSVTALINNPASSNKIYKVNNIIAANITANTAAEATLRIYTGANLGGTAYAIANSIPIPDETSLVIIDKTTSFYLKENQSIGVLANVNSALVFSASWEEFS